MRLEELGPRSLLEMPDGPHGRLEAIAPTVSLLAAQGQPDEIRFRIRLGRHLQGVLRTRHGTVIGITEPLIATGKAFGETWQGDVHANVDVAPVGLDLEAATLVRWADGGEMLRGHERRFGWSAQPERNPVDPPGFLSVRARSAGRPAFLATVSLVESGSKRPTSTPAERLRPVGVARTQNLPLGWAISSGISEITSQCSTIVPSSTRNRS